MGELMKFLPALVLAAAFLSVPSASAAEGARFKRGDGNGDARVDISDAVFVLRSLFLGQGESSCQKALDSNDDGKVDLTDAIFTLSFLFLGGEKPPAPGVQCGVDPTPDSLNCKAYASCPVLPAREPGTSEFATPLAGNPATRTTEGDFGAPAAGPPAPEAPPADKADPSQPERAIEESDIYKLDGDTLFILNRYRGLQIVDLADPTQPRRVGRAPIYGYPKEMYVRGTRAYVIVSDYFTIWRDVLAEDAYPRTFYGSQLRILDISDPADPQVIGGIDLAGDCTDSRIVGDVMYLVSRRYSWYNIYNSDDTVDMTQVVSVAISDPGNIHVVDSEDFPQDGWEQHVHVTQEAIYLASSRYVGEAWNLFEARIQYIDIGDPAGAIAVRGSAPARGRVIDRWSMDEFEGVLRVASNEGWGNGDVYLTTFSVENPDAIVRLGEAVLHVDESLTSARFDGPRGYLVTYRNIDPLFAFDLSNPAKPRLLGELKMTGWLDFMVPQGDRIVALGHEDIVEGDQRKISLAVSLIDVSALSEPKLLSRVTLDGVWGWVPSARDDFAKVFKVLAEQKLILFPYHAWDPVSYRSVGGVQLIDLGRDKLVRRGLIRDAGWVERGISKDEGTVLTLSSELLQVLDIADRDNPKLLGKLELAWNVQDFGLLPGDYTVQLAGDPYLGDLRLVVTPIDDPDTADPLASLEFPAPYGRMFLNGDKVYVTSVQEVPAPEGQATTWETRIQVFDLADPLHPVKRGSMTIPEPLWTSRGWCWGWGDEVVQVQGSVLAFHRYQYYWRYFWAEDGMKDPAEPEKPVQKIYLADLGDPDSPRLAATVEIAGAEWAWGLKASGSTLYLSSYSSEEIDGTWFNRYFLHRIDAADPAAPSVKPKVNIPGMFIDATADGRHVYTLESWWDDGNSTSRNAFHALEVLEDKAFLRSSVEIPGYPNGIQVRDGAAFAATQVYNLQVVGDVVWWGGPAEIDLIAIDLSDPAAIYMASQVKVEAMDYVYLQDVEAGRAFLGSWAGVLVYDVTDIASPAFENFFRTQGWTQDIVVRGSKAYLPAGYYGVQVLDLGGK